jgi:hypothetical protein
MMENAEDKKATDEAGKRSIKAAGILVAAVVSCALFLTV